MNSRRHPYREHERVEELRADDVAWRLRTSSGATALIALLLAGAVVNAATRLAGGEMLLSIARIQLVLAAARLVASVALTTPRPGDTRRIRRVGWALRALVLADLVLVALQLLAPPSVWLVMLSKLGQPFWPALVVASALPAVGLWYVAERLLDLWLPRAAAHTRVVAVLLGACAAAFYGGLSWIGIVLVVLTLLGFRSVLRLRNSVRIAEHEWWLYEPALPGFVWVSLITAGDGRAEVLDADGEILAFADAEQAAVWLGENEYSSAAEATERRLVLASPPSPI